MVRARTFRGTTPVSRRPDTHLLHACFDRVSSARRRWDQRVAGLAPGDDPTTCVYVDLTILGSAHDCSFFSWRLINSSACSASLRASGLNLMAAPLFGTITRSNHTSRKGFTEM